MDNSSSWKFIWQATSFPGFPPTRPTERQSERVGENPGNEVVLQVARWRTFETFMHHNCIIDHKSLFDI